MKINLRLLLTVMALSLAALVNAQDKTATPEGPKNSLYLGFGVGFDYGGIGARLEYLPIKSLGIFGAGGYNLGGFGYNFGASVKLLPKAKVTPTITGMYGYNAMIKIKSDYGFDNKVTTYYGPTFGAGVEIKMGKAKNKLAMSLLVPIRSSKFHDDYDYAKANYGLSDISPVGFSIGYNLSLN